MTPRPLLLVVLFLIYFLHRTTTQSPLAFPSSQLFLIPLLHQTTTTMATFLFIDRCSLFLFYIKPQPGTRRCSPCRRCSLFLFYIKPQLERPVDALQHCCSLFLFYIKPQLTMIMYPCRMCCSLFLFYIKPQLPHSLPHTILVVPYSSSTSHHNCLHSRLTRC